jgi:hypothetical protein
VNPLPTNTFTLANDTICSGTQASFTVNLTGRAPWTIDMDSAGTIRTLTASASLFSYTPVLQNPDSVPISNTFTIRNVRDANGCDDTLDSAPRTVWINPRPNLTLNRTLDSICSLSPTNFALSSGVANTTFNWVIASNDSITGASNSSGSTISQVLDNATSIARNLVYRISTFGPGVLACVGATDSVTVRVFPRPRFTNTDFNDTICSGTPLSGSGKGFVPQISVSGTSYTWTSSVISGNVSYSPTSGSNTPIRDSIYVNNSSANALGHIRYIIRLTGPTPFNCLGDSVIYNVYVRPVPRIQFTANGTAVVDTTTLCQGQNISIGVRDPFTNTLYSSFAWSSNPAGINPTTNPFNYSSTITRRLRVTVNSVDGCTSRDSIVLAINNLPNIVATISSNNFCVNDLQLVTVLNAPVGSSIQFNVGNYPTFFFVPGGPLDTLAFAIDTAGTYSGQVGVNAGGCLVFRTLNFTVNPRPSPAFSIDSLSNGANICASDTFYTINPAGVLGTNVIRNVNGPGVSRVGNVWRFNPSGLSGTITLWHSVQDTVTGCPDSISRTVNITPLPTLTVAPMDTTICEGSSITFNLSGANNYFVKDSIPDPFAPITSTHNVIPTDTTLYYFRGTAAGPLGCSAFDTARVNVNPAVVLNMPADTAICSNITLQLNNPASGGTNQGTWSISSTTPPGGLLFGTLPNVFFTPPVGPSVSTLIFTSNTPSGPCPAAIDSFVVTADTPVFVNINKAIDTVCQGRLYILDSAGGFVAPTALGGVWSVIPASSGTFSSSPATFPGTVSLAVNQTYLVNNINGSLTLTLTAGPNGACPAVSDQMTLLFRKNAIVDVISINPTTVCERDTVRINGSITQAIKTGTWSSSVPGAFTFLNYDSVQTFTDFIVPAGVVSDTIWIYLTSDNSNGACNPETDSIALFINPRPVAIIQDSLVNTCTNQQVNIQSANTGGGITYAWTSLPASSNFIQGSTTGQSITTIQNWPTTGTYFVGLTIFDGTCRSLMDTGRINVLDTVVAFAGNDTLVCLGGPSFDLFGQGALGSGSFTFDWQRIFPAPPGTIQSSNPLNIAVNDTLVRYRFRATDSLTGCFNSDIIQIRASDIQSTFANVGSIQACQGDSISLGDSLNVSGSAVGVYTYRWSPSTGLSDSTIRNPKALVTSTITYTVQVRDTLGCGPATASIQVNVAAKPVPTSISVNPVSAAICAVGGNATLIVNVANPNPTDSYQLYRNGSPFGAPQTNNATFVVDSAGVYFVRVTNAIGCDSASPSVVITRRLPVNLLADSIVFCQGVLTTIKSAPIPGNPNPGYQWRVFGDTTVIGTVDSIQIITVNTYTLTVNDSGCIYSDTIRTVQIAEPSGSIIFTDSVCNNLPFLLSANVTGDNVNTIGQVQVQDNS